MKSNENHENHQKPSFDFKKMDYGTKPSGVKTVVIDLDLDPELMVRDYAKAYAGELWRRNYNLARKIDLQENELYEYFVGILAIHLEKDNRGVVKEWREAKQLWLPAWIQHLLSQVGTYIDQIRGLKFIPHLDHKWDIKQLLDVSDRLAPFREFGLQLFRDAFPRNTEGDPEVMSMIVAEDMVRSISPDAHPSSSYVAAFLGFKLREDLALLNLYRVEYDDVVLIHEWLLREEVIRR